MGMGISGVDYIRAICINIIQRTKKYRNVLALKRVTRLATVAAATNATETVICEVFFCPSLSMLWLFFKCLKPELELSVIINNVIFLQSPQRQYFL
jgi:hypothetical protein